MKKKKYRILFVGIVFVGVLAILFTNIYLKSKRNNKAEEQVELGNRYLSELNYEQAIASYREALTIDSRNRDASMGLAEAYEAVNMYTSAEAAYRDMLDTFGNEADIYESLANLYIRQQKYEEAQELLREANDNVEDDEIQRLYTEANPSAPTMNYASGTYQERIKLEIIPAAEQQTIYFTLDGTVPDIESDIYTGAIILPNGVTEVKAVAVNSLGFQSDIVENEYNIAIRDMVVEIEEPVIESIVRNKANIPWGEEIHNDDIESITELYIIGTAVSEGSNIHSVTFEENSYTVDGYTYNINNYAVIHTLQDLANMPFLETVVIAYQPELDITALSSIESLKNLSLVGNGLSDSDISSISNLKNMETLNISWNQINNINALSDLRNLTSLGIWGNNVQSIEAVKNMKLLRYLDFSDNRVVDISPVTALSDLEQLWMYHNQIADISSIVNLPKLNVLMLYDNPIANPETVRDIYAHLERIDVDLLNLGDKK